MPPTLPHSDRLVPATCIALDPSTSSSQLSTSKPFIFRMIHNFSITLKSNLSDGNLWLDRVTRNSYRSDWQHIIFHSIWNEIQSLSVPFSIVQLIFFSMRIGFSIKIDHKLRVIYLSFDETKVFPTERTKPMNEQWNIHLFPFKPFIIKIQTMRCIL